MLENNANIKKEDAVKIASFFCTLAFAVLKSCEDQPTPDSAPKKIKSPVETLPKKNVQVKSTATFKIPIDNLSNITWPNFLKAHEKKEGTIIESRSKGITSKYTLVNDTDNDITLTEFDCAVLNAAISIKNAGNEFTTPEIIYRTLGGGHVLTDEMHKNIMNSLERLSAVRITVDMPDAKKKLGYGIDRNKTSFTGYLMPTEHVDTKINGQLVSSIHFS